jgi:ABC-type iron transport system FetAB ATPase subunit
VLRWQPQVLSRAKGAALDDQHIFNVNLHVWRYIMVSVQTIAYVWLHHMDASDAFDVGLGLPAGLQLVLVLLRLSAAESCL